MPTSGSMKLNFKSIYLLGLYVQCSTHVYMQFLKIPKELVNTQLDQPVENSRKVFLLSMPKCHKNFWMFVYQLQFAQFCHRCQLAELS